MPQLPNVEQHLTPTQMGERILAFMSANYLTDLVEFAEGVVGIPAETFRSWIYDKVEPETLPVKPMLVCSEALGTNAEYLACMTDDPRPGVQLTYDEGVLLQTFRDIASEHGQQRLLRVARELATAHPAQPNQNSPFTKVPLRLGRHGPANEM